MFFVTYLNVRKNYACQSVETDKEYTVNVQMIKSKNGDNRKVNTHN